MDRSAHSNLNKLGTVVAISVIIFGGSVRSLSSQQVLQTVLSGATVPKFVEPLPTFLGRRVGATNEGSALTITAKEFQQQILPASFYLSLTNSVTYWDVLSGRAVARINPQKGTYVWGYQVDFAGKTYGPSYPSPSIEVESGRAVTAHMANHLIPYRDMDGRGLPGPLLQQFLTVDQSFHWANPLGAPMNLVTMDRHTGLALGNPEFYAGPQPAVVHLHGSISPSAYDGHAKSWSTPGEEIVGPGFVTSTYQFPNVNEPSMLWYHDHTLGETRLNVYAGLAGFYFIRGNLERAVSPALPSGAQEVEILIQDRQFDSNGQLFFPDGNPAGVGLNGDPGNPTIHPYSVPEFFGDVIVVNGKSWPYSEVEPRRYRFRILNGCNARFLSLSLTNAPGFTPVVSIPKFWQIGSDGGLFDRPVDLSSFVPFTLDPGDISQSIYGSPNLTSPRLLMAPGERADLIIDFSTAAGKTLVMANDANYPYPGGNAPDSTNDGLIMQFRVRPKVTFPDNSFNPAIPNSQVRRDNNRMVHLTDGHGKLAPGTTIHNVRRLVLVEQEDPDTGSPIKVLINNTHYDGLTPMGRFDWQNGEPISESVPYNQGTIQVTEMPQIGSTEVWEFVNLTPDSHPMHIHLIQFQVLSQQILKVGATVPNNTPPYVAPPIPFFTTPGYRTDAYEAAWFQLGSFQGTRYGGGSPFNYLRHGQPMGGNPDPTPYLIGNNLPYTPPKNLADRLTFDLL